MTLREYAHSKAEELMKKPTRSTVVKVVNDIRNLNVNGKPITDAQIEEILDFLEIELGDISLLCESFENKEVLSLMNEVRKIIAQANSGKKDSI